MITLSILIILWGIISTYRIDKICKEKNVGFNPFEGRFVDFGGYVVGLSVLVVCVIFLSVVFFP
jgi:hypothetical protein